MTKLKNSDDFINKILKKVTSISQDETNITPIEKVSKDVYRIMKEIADNRGRGNSLRVTDLCNPMQAFYDITKPNIQNPDELTRKFRYGKFIEGRVNVILSREEGYVPPQGNVNGTNVEMADVNGKIDFRIREKIIEFKTSEYDIPDKDVLFTKNPQDLEQLLLYILFTDRTNEEHTLLYLTGRHPNLKPREFRVKIKDKEKIISYFKSRHDKLKKAIETRNSQGLGKCRYFNATCKFKLEGLCNCDNEEDIDISEIKNNVFVELVEDGIGNKLANAQLIQNYEKSIGIWDILTPRKWLMKIKHPYDYDDWEDDDEYKYELRKEIEKELVEEGRLTKDRLSVDIPEIKDQLFLQILSGDPATNESHSEKYPILIRVQDDNPKNPLNYYYIAQIGLACALSNNNTGYVFVFYRNPEVGTLYKIKFSKLGDIKQEALNIINETVRSAKEKKFTPNSPFFNLPFCPKIVRINCNKCVFCKDFFDHVIS
jgi:hypothetical protein